MTHASPMKDLVATAKALADMNRVRAFMALRVGELCACQIIALLRLAPSTVSRHMAILVQAGLVAGRRQGRWMYYRLADARTAPDPVRRAIAWVGDVLDTDPTVQADREKLSVIASENPSRLCALRRRRRHG